MGADRRNPAFAALAESLERRAGVRVAAAVRWPFCLPEPDVPAGAATAHLPERDGRKVLADLETALGPWVDTARLRVVTEANIAVAAR